MYFVVVAASTWEIRNLNTTMGLDRPRCLVTHTLEIHSQSWYRWKNNQHYTKFEKSIPYALLCQVAGQVIELLFPYCINLSSKIVKKVNL